MKTINFILLIVIACSNQSVFGEIEPGNVRYNNDSTQSDKNNVQNKKEHLLDIPIPDLAALEASVSEQLTRIREQILTGLKSASVSVETLSKSYEELANVYHAYELYDAAEICYLNSISLNQQSLSAKYLLGYLYQQNGKFNKAIIYFKKVLDKEPDNFSILIRLGESYQAINELEKSAGIFRGAAKLNPTEAVILAKLGDISMRNKEFQQAIEYYQNALDKQPAANRLHYSMALAYRAFKKNKLARKHFNLKGGVGVKAKEPLIDNLSQLLRGERVYLLRGKLAFSFGRFKEAAEAFKKAIAEAPYSIRAHINLAATLNHLNDKYNAQKFLQKALDIDPGNLTANYNLGVLFEETNQFEKALTYFIKAENIEPDDVSLQLKLGSLLTQLNQQDKAFSHYEKALNLNPLIPSAWLSQVRYLIKQKQYQSAIKKLNHANSLMPDNGSIAHYLARTLVSNPNFKLRNGNRGLELAEKVFTAEKSPEHALTLAMAYAEMGQCSRAAQLQRSLNNQLEKHKTQFNDNLDLIKLKALLHFYENKRPCRYIDGSL